ncbi:hypothetical protein AUJ77_00170 [Candidatus Nomurabacteria bacterium CG1_02_43_90]|uniref:Uncharacterized protein n=1 Tax=Candidatus Nomurabacteria bacterium CG1_02_43_90 TaxID=1805281 RepID=A0A1J4V234_9BACT|nr:MAG: hypothetical protein AUJ77_00170 [Candidatus Nomurabacteria bacterium CG1_02_43_90]
MKNNLRVVACVFLSVFFFFLFGAYLDRPTVEVDVDTQLCVRAYGPHGEISCSDALRVAHEKVFVDSRARREIKS